MLYIRLFHGRTDPVQEMNDWGKDGPIFGPYNFAHTTYTSCISLGKADGNCDSLYVLESDMAYYDGVYYGDWSVFEAGIFNKSKYQTSVFEQNNAKRAQ